MVKMAELECMVRGYHVYKHVWMAVDGELLQCRREPHNIHDPFAVSVMKEYSCGTLAMKVHCSFFSSFLRRSGTIVCRVNGSRRYLVDPPQGGLEVPCILLFSGEPSLIKKIMKHTANEQDATNGSVVEAKNGSEGNDSIVDMTGNSCHHSKRKMMFGSAGKTLVFVCL